MKGSLRQFCCAVQRNCHISDARHGADYGLCTYLLKMREYYRWENGLDYGASLTNESVGEWLTRREQLWDSLSDDDFTPLPFAGRLFDPFDVDRINELLDPFGLVYSAGYGSRNKPLFFLGHLERREEPGGATVWVAGRELARDLMAPAAMCQGNRIFIRQESFRRLLWEKLENWRWHRPDNAMGRAFAYYDFEDDLEHALDQMVEQELDVVLLHEQGEYHAGKLLGEEWNQLLTALGHSPAELMARAVRDHWADCQVTLPRLIEREDRASVHFFVGGLGGMRKTLFPSLITAYERWHAEGDWQPLKVSIQEGREHWSALAGEVLKIHREQPDQARVDIKSLLEGNKL
ncbi:MAG: Sfum_1244 family protein [Candidatus Thiodiazotropha endolucinida]